MPDGPVGVLFSAFLALLLGCVSGTLVWLAEELFGRGGQR